MGGSLVPIFAVAVLCLCLGEAFSLNDEQALVSHLLGRYKRAGVYARPVVRANDTLTVRFGTALQRILNLNKESDGLAYIKAKMWHRYVWNDAVLVWDPSTYGGVDSVRLPIDRIWHPDIYLFNSMGMPSPEDNNVWVVVNSDGSVQWIPPAIDRAPCVREDVTDDWSCEFVFGSWTHDSSKLQPEFYGDQSMDVSGYSASSKYEIVSNTAQRNIKIYPCCAEEYGDLTFTLTLNEL